MNFMQRARLSRGAKPSLEDMRHYAERAQNFSWDKSAQVGYFTNLNPEARFIKRASMWEVGKYYLCAPKNAKPKAPLPFISLHLPHHLPHHLPLQPPPRLPHHLPHNPSASDNPPSPFQNLAQSPSFVWLGHSSYLILYRGLRLLIDPILSAYASPYPFVNRAFYSEFKPTARELGEIDVLLITHDHFDHLDYPSMLMLKNQVKHFIVPLGVGAHLRLWGVERGKISELAWWESVDLERLGDCGGVDFEPNSEVDSEGADFSKADSETTPDSDTLGHFAKSKARARLTCTPSQHSSGRGMEWQRTLWCSYVLELGGKKIFLSGDGGYYTHFREIGERFGGVDVAILENGQYNAAWRHSHSFAHEVLQEALDLRAGLLIPIHYGRFVAGSHAWNEPLLRLIELCDEAGLPLSAPRMGEVYDLDSPPRRETWWE